MHSCKSLLYARGSDFKVTKCLARSGRESADKSE